VTKLSQIIFYCFFLGVNFINILRTHFSYEIKLSSFSLHRVWLWTNFCTKNARLKCWWNWLQVKRKRGSLWLGAVFLPNLWHHFINFRALSRKNISPKSTNKSAQIEKAAEKYFAWTFRKLVTKFFKDFLELLYWNRDFDCE